ncbi:MAG TPA: hypothetical protein VGB85_32525, partial [Nannocystis sp.]
MLTPARTLLLSCLMAGTALVACGSTLAGIVRSRAAGDLGCPENQLAVRDMHTGDAVRDFSVSGCGRQEHYQAACDPKGTCQVVRPGDATRYPAPPGDARTAGVEDPKPADEGVTTVVDEGVTTVVAEAPPEAEPEGQGEAGSIAAGDEAARGEAMAIAKDLPPAGTPSTAPASKLPPAEERTVTLRNNCARRVVFYIGKQPGESDGRYMTVGSTNMISPRLR